MKALMGIEYTLIISLFLVVLTLGSSISQDDSDSGDNPPGPPGDPGSGGEPIPGLGGTRPEPAETVGGPGGTAVYYGSLGKVTVTDLMGEIEQVQYQKAVDNIVTVLNMVEGRLEIEKINDESYDDGAAALIVPVKASRSATLKWKPLGQVTNAAVTTYEVKPGPTYAAYDLAFGSDREIIAIHEIKTENMDRQNVDGKVTFRFTVSNFEMDQAATEPDRVVLTHFNPEQGIRTNINTVVIEKTSGYTVFEAYIPSELLSSSLFVINANNIVSIKSCDKNGICEPGESITFCPTDCSIPADRIDQSCIPGQNVCFGDTIFTCVSNGEDYKEGNRCPAGCRDGSCVDPSASPSEGLNVFFTAVVAGLVVMAIFMATIFLRR